MEKKKCVCGGTLHEMGRREFRLGPNTLFHGPAWLNTETLELEIAVCGSCREVKLFLPKEAVISAGERYRDSFERYSDDDLQRIVENANYLPEAHQVAEAILWERKK